MGVGRMQFFREFTRRMQFFCDGGVCVASKNKRKVRIKKLNE